MGLPGYLGAKRVYIAWRDDLHGTCGVFNLGRGHSDSVRSGSRQTNELAGRLNKEGKDIAASLNISPKTVDTYKQRVNEKIGLAHRADYVRFAMKLGLLEV